MVEKFPDLFEIGGTTSATPRAPAEAAETASTKAPRSARPNSMKFEDGKLDSMDLSDENVEKALVIAARTQLARQRQQLLASLVIMGINRIVVTDGKISRRSCTTSRRATCSRASAQRRSAYDYRPRCRAATSRSTWAREGKDDQGGTDTRSDTSRQGKRQNYDADYYSKGKYKYEEQPVMTAMSTASEASDVAAADPRAVGRRRRGQFQERLPAAREDGDAGHDRGDPGQLDAGRSERRASVRKNPAAPAPARRPRRRLHASVDPGGSSAMTPPTATPGPRRRRSKPVRRRCASC